MNVSEISKIAMALLYNRKIKSHKLYEDSDEYNNNREYDELIDYRNFIKSKNCYDIFISSTGKND